MVQRLQPVPRARGISTETAGSMGSTCIARPYRRPHPVAGGLRNRLRLRTTAASWLLLSEVSSVSVSEASTADVLNMWWTPCILGIATILTLALWSNGRLRSQLPSGPSPPELFSHLSRSAFMQEEWVRKHGDIFQTWVPFLSVVCVSDPDATRYIAVQKGNSYRDPCVFGRLGACFKLVIS